MNDSTNFTNSTKRFQPCSPAGDTHWEKTWKTASYGILAFLSVLGNSLVIATVYRNKNLRSTTHRMILNMAISDLLLPMFAVPRQIGQIWHQSWLINGVVGKALCKLFPFFQDISGAVSVLSLVIIAVDRLWLVVFPTKRPFFKVQRTTVAIIATWVIASSLYVAYFYSSRLVTLSGELACQYNWEPAFDNATASKIHFLVSFISLVILPLILLIVIYGSIVRVLHQREKSALHISKTSKAKRTKRNRKIMIMLFVTVTVFFLSWAPINIFGFLLYFLWDFSRECNLNVIVFILVFLSFSYSALNPLIYYTFNANYREGFNRLLCCCCVWSKRRAFLPSHNFISKRKKISVDGRLGNGEDKPTQTVELIELRAIDIQTA